MDAFALLLVAGLGAVVGLVVALMTHRWPVAAISSSFLLVLLGATKFRLRDPTATLAGNVDAQVVFEIGAFGLLAVIVAMAALSLRLDIRWLTRWEWILLAFGGLALASTVWSPISFVTLVRAVQLLTLLGLAIVAMRTLGPDGTFRALTWSVAVYVVVMALLAATVPAASGVREVSYEVGGRFSWFGVHPILAATLAGLGAALLIAEGLYVPRERWTRLAGVPVIVLVAPLIVVLLAARARGPLIAFAAAVLVLVLRRFSRPWLATLALGFSVMAAIGLVAFNTGMVLETWLRDSALSDNPAIEYLTRGNTLEYLTTLGGRTELWGEIVQLVVERPIVGWGYAASREIVLERVPWAGYAHNAFVQTLVDLGVVGTALIWAAVLAATVADLLKRRWAGSPAGAVRGRVFVALVFTLVLSIVSESFAGAPGYELLLVFSAVLASERSRVPVAPAD